MTSSQKVLLSCLAVAFAGMVIFLQTNFGGKFGDLVVFTIFGVALVAMAYLALSLSRTKQGVVGRSWLFRLLRAVFASLAAAFAIAMLVGIALTPWVGEGVFAFFFNQPQPWALVVLACVLFPLVHWRLR